MYFIVLSLRIRHRRQTHGVPRMRIYVLYLYKLYDPGGGVRGVGCGGGGRCGLGGGGGTQV